MKASVMRAVDWYLGLPACMVLAAGRALARAAAAPEPRDPPDGPRNVLVIKFLGAGSICLAAPMLRATREIYPSARIHFLTFAENAAAVRLLGLVDAIHTVRRDHAGAFLGDTLRVIGALRRERIDLAFDLEFFAKYPLIFCALANVRRIAGFYLTLEPWLRRMLDVHGYYNHYFHVKDIFLSLLYVAHTGDHYYLGFDEWVRRYPQVRLPISETSRETVRDVLRRHGWTGQRVIVVNPNAGKDVSPELRKWPPERFAQLIGQILARYAPATIALIGSRDERTDVEQVIAHLPAGAGSSVYNLAGELELGVLPALFDLSAAFVTIDSGPMHIASMTGVPVVGLFFADTPVLFGPLAERRRAVFKSIYALPLYTVYTGKEAFVDANRIALTVEPEEVLAALVELVPP